MSLLNILKNQQDDNDKVNFVDRNKFKGFGESTYSNDIFISLIGENVATNAQKTGILDPKEHYSRSSN